MALRPAHAALAAIALSVGLSTAACSPDPTPVAGATTTAGNVCPDGRIRFGVEPYEDPAKLTPAYETIAKALEKAMHCPVELTIVEDYSAEVLAMQNGKLDVAQFGPLGYVFAHDKAKAEALVSFGTADGKLSTYTAGIWVPKGSAITSITGLKGKKLALSSVGSTSGDALPRQALGDAGIALDALKVEYAGGHPEALLALTNGKVDAAEINSQTLATAIAAGTFKEADYTKIWASKPIPNDPITVRGDLPQEFKDGLAKALTSLPPETIGQVGAFLDVTPPGPLLPVTSDTYAPLFSLAKALGLTERDV